ncbi:hypothetical protein OS21_33850 [Dickeya oryzae]
MDTILNNTKLMSSDNELVSDAAVTRLKRLISTGNALVFVGAGFSIESKNICGTNPPLAKNLALQISDRAAEYLEKNKCRCRAYNGN